MKNIISEDEKLDIHFYTIMDLKGDVLLNELNSGPVRFN
jgi:hypothetical protein